MAKKPEKPDDKKQSQRFLDKVQELVDAGELSPTEADEKFDTAISRILRKKEDNRE